MERVPSIADIEFQLDMSRRVLDWIKEKNYGVIDVNTTRCFPTHRSVSLEVACKSETLTLIHYCRHCLPREKH